MTVQDGDTIKMAAKQLGPDGQDVINIFWHEADSGVGGFPDASWTTAMLNWVDGLYNAMANRISSQYTADSVEFYNQTQQLPMGEFPWPTYTGGTAPGDPMPAGVAGLISAGTQAKRVLPKKFLSGIVEANCDGDRWNAATLVQLAAFAVSWLTNVPIIALVEAVPGTWRRVLSVFVPLISAAAKALTSYQRRRKPGVGA